MNRIQIATLAAMMACAGPVAALAQDSIGQAEFMKNCAVCHGADGAGNGPILDFLKAAPADLTTISARNGGQFPFQAMYDTIADVDSNRAHGTSEMPVWGDRFNMDIIAQEGEFGTGESGIPAARTRILELVFYLATIQQQ